MNDGFSWWLVVLGIAVGIGLVWLFTVRLPVRESDVDAEETIEEAGWISETIESLGGVAPAALVQEVLELHRRYLDGDRSMRALADEADDGARDEAFAASASEVDPSAVAGRPADPLPADPLPADVSPAPYAPPTHPPAGGFAEIPPAAVPRAETD